MQDCGIKIFCYFLLKVKWNSSEGHLNGPCIPGIILMECQVSPPQISITHTKHTQILTKENLEAALVQTPYHFQFSDQIFSQPFTSYLYICNQGSRGHNSFQY